jgi:acyl-CoA thioesterase
MRQGKSATCISVDCMAGADVALRVLFSLAAPVTAGEWFLLRSTSQRASDGYSYQTMEIWSEQGQLVLSGSQTVTIFV